MKNLKFKREMSSKEIFKVNKNKSKQETIF